MKERGRILDAEDHYGGGLGVLASTALAVGVGLVQRDAPGVAATALGVPGRIADVDAIELNDLLTLSVVLFCIGLYGVLTRRYAVAILMSLEWMFNAVNISLVAFTRFAGGGVAHAMGQMFPLFVITVAAAEVTIGVAIVLTLYRNFHHINVEEVDLLKG